MEDSKREPTQDSSGSKASPMKSAKIKNNKKKKDKTVSKFQTISTEKDVVFKAGALKYKLPGKQQRIIIGSIVLGLNILFGLSVVLYFYSPSFKDLIYNLGR